MLQATIPNQSCVRRLCRKLSLLQLKALALVNGQLEKHSLLLRSTKPLAGGTEIESPPTIP